MLLKTVKYDGTRWVETNLDFPIPPGEGSKYQGIDGMLYNISLHFEPIDKLSEKLSVTVVLYKDEIYA